MKMMYGFILYTDCGCFSDNNSGIKENAAEWGLPFRR